MGGTVGIIIEKEKQEDSFIFSNDKYKGFCKLFRSI
jgi:hypothetical protein